MAQLQQIIQKIQKKNAIATTYNIKGLKKKWLHERTFKCKIPINWE